VPGGGALGLGGFASMWDIQNDYMTIATSFKARAHEEAQWQVV